MSPVGQPITGGIRNPHDNCWSRRAQKKLPSLPQGQARHHNRRIKFPNNQEGASRLAAILKKHGDARVALESTGNLWVKLCDRLDEEECVDVILTNPKKTRMIAEAKIEADKIDARLLAELQRLDELETHIDAFTGKIAQEAVMKPEVKLLMGFTGIDYYSAMLLASEIGDVTRFPSAKKLVSYAGLAPSTHESGDSILHGSIRKASEEIENAIREYLGKHEKEVLHFVCDL